MFAPTAFRHSLVLMLAVLLVTGSSIPTGRGAPVTQQDIEDDDAPVPPRSELIKAWRQREDLARTARFAWSERRVQNAAWVPNPRYAEPDRSSDKLVSDTGQTKEVTKTLSLVGDTVQFSSDGVPREPDVQSLDLRPILIAIRPLHPRLGDLPFRHSFTSTRRYRYKGRSMMIVEEKHDSRGWKASLWVEPERDFVVGRCLLYLHDKIVVDVEIEYSRDLRWGWFPSGWRVLHTKSDGSRWESTVATVTMRIINRPQRSGSADASVR